MAERPKGAGLRFVSCSVLAPLKQAQSSAVAFRVRLFAAAAATLCLSVPIIAADGAAKSPRIPGGGVGAIAIWYICSSRKNQEIGGWLLYYYIQLYLGVTVSLVLLAFSFQNYLPTAWDAQPLLYTLFLMSMLPTLALFAIQLVVAEKLRRSRDYEWLRRLRSVLWAGLAVAVLGFAIDYNYFEDSVVFDVVTLIFSTIWLAYFCVSRRVTRVFRTKDWVAHLSIATIAPPR
jgi:hypothetical protein